MEAVMRKWQKNIILEKILASLDQIWSPTNSYMSLSCTSS